MKDQATGDQPTHVRRSSDFVVPHSHELDVPDMVRICPFEKFEIGNEAGFHPHALLHLRGSESFSPSPAPRLGKISNGHAFMTRGLRRACIAPRYAGTYARDIFERLPFS